MGQKVNPIGFRLAIRRDWKSRWYTKGREFSEWVIKDAEARRYIERVYKSAAISRIEIERTMQKINLIIYSARPGVVIGKKGEGIERLRNHLRKMLDLHEVSVDLKEVTQPETDAKLIALNIASQLENRIMFRRAMRRALSNALRLKVEGIKIMSAGRLNGIEIARTEWYREGRVPLHTLKNNIDYGWAQANTEMGVVGVKVWVFKGDTTERRKKAKYTYEGGTKEAAQEAIQEATVETVPAVPAVPAVPSDDGKKGDEHVTTG